LSSHQLSSNYALFIGLRYSFSRKRNRFTAVIALVSMLGMTLGVASLIIVLSVMNGFAGELRGRILSLVPHGYVESTGGGIEDWKNLLIRLQNDDNVEAASPYLSDKAILTGRNGMRGAVLTAIDPAYESAVSDIGSALTQGSLDTLDQEKFNVVMGAGLARALGVQVGDVVEATVPRLTVTPLGIFPRSKRLTLSGVFTVGAQLDSYQAYISLAAGQKLLGHKNQVDGLRVKTTDLFEAPRTLSALSSELPEDYKVTNWSQTQGSLFRAVKMEKLMVSLLLLSVVAVAAFNIVSTLVMSVAEKRSDIAVLRTMGAQAKDIMALFIAHGLALALVGVGFGTLIGIALASYISEITVFVENLFGVKLFDPSVYFISELPSKLMWQDVGVVITTSLLLSFLATLYPAWRASQVAPAEVLRYE
jgi:lipoprotein-releasing system permease protein